jgi:DNA polymerase III alpha subunit
LVQIADGYGIPLSVSSDAHFLDENQRYLRRAIQAISWHKSFEDVDESLKSNCLGNDDLILKFAEETSFDLDIVKKALHQTERISQKCNAQLEGAYPKIPVFNKHDKLDELFEQVRW